MEAHKATLILDKALERLGIGCNMVTRAGIVVALGLTTVEVILRGSLNITIPGAIELIEISLVILFFSGIAYLSLTKGHIRVDIVLNRFPPTARSVVLAFADLAGVVVLGMISWRSIVYAQSLAEDNYVTMVHHLPMSPLPIIIAIFTAIFLLALFRDFLKHAAELRDKEKGGYLWIISVAAILPIFITAMRPDILPMGIPPNTFGIIAFVAMFVLIFLGVHIGNAMAVASIWGMSYLTSPASGMSLLAMTSYRVPADYTWGVIPLFVLMGIVVSRAAFSRDLFYMMYKWLGRLPGGLASATVGASAGFAAVVGDSVSGVLTMGTIALPEMKSYKYDDKLAAASVAAGGTIGVLIPPSLAFIVYGIAVEESIGRLFIAGILPGLLLTGALIALITIRTRRRPALGPPGPASTFGEKISSIKGALPIIALFLLVIGGIYGGLFTPTEAGAIGAFGAIVMALAMRRFKFGALGDMLTEASQSTSMVFFILIYAFAFTQFLAVSGVPTALSHFLAGLTIPRVGVLWMVLALYLGLGCVMNALPVLVLTLPIVFPVITGLGYNSIWFGVIVAIMCEIGVITPPIGVNIFAMRAVSNLPMYSVVRGLIPFWVVMLGVIGILTAFPQIALFLPNLMRGG